MVSKFPSWLSPLPGQSAAVNPPSFSAFSVQVPPRNGQPASVAGDWSGVLAFTSLWFYNALTS
jgi:hypothetical protein